MAPLPPPSVPERDQLDRVTARPTGHRLSPSAPTTTASITSAPWRTNKCGTLFMDNIVNSERDVPPAPPPGHHRECPQERQGKAVAKLFNLDSSLNTMRKTVGKHCKKPCNMWRANLVRT
ncbi:Glycerophosphodiester phosphodiesterase [Psidium guajava]|nr:Glycerophosphodiester phosphodiesterase [Psidium guajava]